MNDDDDDFEDEGATEISMDEVPFGLDPRLTIQQRPSPAAKAGAAALPARVVAKAPAVAPKPTVRMPVTAPARATIPEMARVTAPVPVQAVPVQAVPAVAAPAAPVAPPQPRTSTKRGHEPVTVAGQRPDLEEEARFASDDIATSIETPNRSNRPTAKPGFDPSGRIDDNRRTNKIASSDLEAVTKARPAHGPAVIDRRQLRDRIDEIHQGALKARAATPAKGVTEPRQDPLAGLDDSNRRARVDVDAIEDHLQTFKRDTPPKIAAPVRAPTAEPMRMVSMKTPDSFEAPKAARPAPEVNLRALSEMSGAHTPPQVLGRIAPPFDPRQARSRRVRDIVFWACIAVILASVVTLVIWFAAGR